MRKKEISSFMDDLNFKFLDEIQFQIKFFIEH